MKSVNFSNTITVTWKRVSLALGSNNLGTRPTSLLQGSLSYFHPLEELKDPAAKLELTMPLVPSCKEGDDADAMKVLLLKADSNRSTGYPVFNNSISIPVLYWSQVWEASLSSCQSWVEESLRFPNPAATAVLSLLKTMSRGSFTWSKWNQNLRTPPNAGEGL